MTEMKQLAKRVKELEIELTKAKELIKRLMHELVVSNRPYDEVDLLVKDVEQFLNGDGCPDCLCEDCTKEDCGIKKLGLVEK